MPKKPKKPSKEFGELAKKEFNDLYREGYTLSYIARFAGVDTEFISQFITEKSKKIHNTKTPIR